LKRLHVHSLFAEHVRIISEKRITRQPGGFCGILATKKGLK
jgi:hypothetical protein